MAFVARRDIGGHHLEMIGLLPVVAHVTGECHQLIVVRREDVAGGKEHDLQSCGPLLAVDHLARSDRLRVPVLEWSHDEWREKMLAEWA